MFLSLYTTRVVLRELGASDFGIFAVIVSLIAMLNFLNVSMAQATQRFMSYTHGEKDEEKQKEIFNISFFIHTCVGVSLVALLFALGPFAFTYVLTIEPDRLHVAKVLYYLIAGTVIFSVVSVPYQAVLAARENMLMVAILGLIEALIRFGIAIGLTYTSSDKLLVYGIGMALIPLILLMVQSIFCHLRYQECRFILGRGRNPVLRKEMLGFAGWAFIGGAANGIALNSQGLILNAFFGTVLNAAQGVSRQLTRQLGVLAIMSNKAVVPVLTKFEGARDRSKVRLILHSGSKVSFFLKMIIFIPVFICAPYLLNLWLVDPPPYALEFCRLLLFAELVKSFNLNLAQAIQAEGRIKYYHIATSIRAIFLVLASVVVLSMFGNPVHLYWLIVLDSLVSFELRLRFVSKNLDLSSRDYLRAVVGPCLVSTVVAAMLPIFFFGLSPDSFVKFFGVVVVSFLSAVSVFACFGLSVDESRLLKSFFSYWFTRFNRGSTG